MRFLALIFVGLALVGCKPPKGSDLGTLDNFALNSGARMNVCSADVLDGESFEYMTRIPLRVHVDAALESGLQLGRTTLDILLDQLAVKADQMALELEVTPQLRSPQLNRLREQATVESATVFSPAGQIAHAASSASLSPTVSRSPLQSTTSPHRSRRRAAAPMRGSWMASRLQRTRPCGRLKR